MRPAERVYARIHGRLSKRLYRAATLHAKETLALKPALSKYWHRRLDDIDKKLGFS